MYGSSSSSDSWEPSPPIHSGTSYLEFDDSDSDSHPSSHRAVSSPSPPPDPFRDEEGRKISTHSGKKYRRWMKDARSRATESESEHEIEGDGKEKGGDEDEEDGGFIRFTNPP